MCVLFVIKYIKETKGKEKKIKWAIPLVYKMRNKNLKNNVKKKQHTIRLTHSVTTICNLYLKTLSPSLNLKKERHTKRNIN